MSEKEIILIIGLIAGAYVFFKLRKVLFFLSALGIAAFAILYFSQGMNFPSINNDSIPKLQNVPPALPQKTNGYLPDLTVKWVEKPSGKFPCDSQISIVASVSNRGQSKAHNISVTHNGCRSSQHISELNPNQSRKLRFYPELPKFSGGSGFKKIYFQFMVDPRNTVEESNESNNNSQEFYVECF